MFNGKYKNLRIPQSYSEAFDMLGESKILDTSFAYKFAKIAGFRNFLTHVYEKTEVRFICKDIMDKLEDVDSFIRQIENSL